jgi:hypothetical protein
MKNDETQGTSVTVTVRKLNNIITNNENKITYKIAVIK